MSVSGSKTCIELDPIARRRANVLLPLGPNHTTPHTTPNTQHGNEKEEKKQKPLIKPHAAAAMLFKHQLPRPLRDNDTPLLEVGAASSTAGPPTSVFLAAKSGPRRLHVFKWDRFLGVIEAPGEVTCCKLLPSAGREGRPGMALVVGCRPGSVYRVEDVEARLSGGAIGGARSCMGTLCLGADELCLTLPEDVSRIDKLMVVTEATACEPSTQQVVVVAVERKAGTALYHIRKATSVAGPSMLVLNSPGQAMACFSSSTGNDPILLHVCHDRNDDLATAFSGSHLYSTTLTHENAPTKGNQKEKNKAALLHTFDKQVVAVLSVPMQGEKDAMLVAVERDGHLSLLPDPRETNVSQSNREQVRMARLQLSLAEGGLRAAVLVDSSDIIACLSTRGSVWLARISLLFSEPPSFFPSSSSNINCVRLDCAPEVVALAAPSSSSTSQSPVLSLLTRRGRLLSFQDFPSIPPSLHLAYISPLAAAATTAAGSTTPAAPAAPVADEAEALLQQIEQACQRTQASHQQLAHTEEAIEKLRTAWTVLAGKGLLGTSLDVAHPSSSSASPSPLLKVRLHNPTESETLPLQGWSLMVRIEAAAASAAQGPAASLLPALSPPAAAVLAGASWGLDDIGPGEDFEAHMALPVTGSLLPQTVRVSLCCPFVGAGDSGSETRASSLAVQAQQQQQQQQQQQAGVCLELGSRPLDMLDLARPPKKVPVTPMEMRAMEAAAAKQGRNQSWEGVLARLMFEKVACDADEDGGGAGNNKDTAGTTPDGRGGAITTMPLPRPLISSTLRILWPAMPIGAEQQHEAMDFDAASPSVSLPALVDLLGPCDGARIIEEGGGRALALQASGGRLLLARLLAGEARIRMDENESSEATGLQLSLTGTDQGLVSLLRAACCQRLGVGGSVRTRRLPLTDTRMKTLETAHHQATALAAELQEAIQRDRAKVERTMLVETERKCLQKSLELARRVMTLAVALGKEVDEAFLLDLR